MNNELYVFELDLNVQNYIQKKILKIVLDMGFFNNEEINDIVEKAMDEKLKNVIYLFSEEELKIINEI